jgi:ElaB/YqjD/DUF883 family membrane-anchored ribosome-binding protein
MMKRNSDHTAAHQAASAVDHVADGIRSAAHNVRQAATRAVDAVGDTCEEVGQYACDSVNRTRARARSMEESFETSVRDNPKTSLLLAAAVGVVIGSWWRRK